jgi:hypothetical protein
MVATGATPVQAIPQVQVAAPQVNMAAAPMDPALQAKIAQIQYDFQRRALLAEQQAELAELDMQI